MEAAITGLFDRPWYRPMAVLLSQRRRGDDCTISNRIFNRKVKIIGTKRKNPLRKERKKDRISPTVPRSYYFSERGACILRQVISISGVISGDRNLSVRTKLLAGTLAHALNLVRSTGRKCSGTSDVSDE